MDKNKNKILAVIGSRNFTNYSYLEIELLKHEPAMIVSGGADGADSLGNRFAKEYGLPIMIYYPNWNKFGKSAGFKRNKQIIDYCEEVIAFQVNESRGTQNSIDLAKQQDKIVYIHKF